MKIKNPLNIGTGFQKFQDAYFDIFSSSPNEAFLFMYFLKKFSEYNFFGNLMEDGSFYLSYSKIQKECFRNNTSIPSIFKYVQGLEQKKMIKKISCMSGNQGNYYLINFDYLNRLVEKREIISNDFLDVDKEVNQEQKAVKIKISGDNNSFKEELMKYWNEIAVKHNLPKVRVVSEKNIKDIRSNMKEIGIESFEGYFKEIERAVERSDFLRGKNDRGWKINFHFVTQKSSMNKLVNNSYENGGGGIFNSSTYTKKELEALRRNELIDKLYEQDKKLLEF